jgi:hypothetical protein
VARREEEERKSKRTRKAVQGSLCCPLRDSRARSILEIHGNRSFVQIWETPRNGITVLSKGP